tara:strand:- start:2733 stop:2909 length:177 start_codon:yes stop_codon:yes gene_type:complete
MKIYDVIKITNGFQVVWYWSNGYTKTGFKALENFVDNGFFKTKLEAKNLAENLQLEEM